HLGWVFEELARDHAGRLVAAGRLPSDLLIGRWWSTSGADAEVDVLGMRGTRSVLLGEARWPSRPLGAAAVARLRERMRRVPEPVSDPLLVLWGRGGVDDTARSRGALGFDLQQMLEP